MPVPASSEEPSSCKASFVVAAVHFSGALGALQDETTSLLPTSELLCLLPGSEASQDFKQQEVAPRPRELPSVE